MPCLNLLTCKVAASSAGSWYLCTGLEKAARIAHSAYPLNSTLVHVLSHDTLHHFLLCALIPRQVAAGNGVARAKTGILDEWPWGGCLGR